MNRQIVLTARPDPAVTEQLFAAQDAPRPEPGPDQMLIRVLYLSMEPAMRGWIAKGPNYSEPVPIGGPMRSFTLGEVAASNLPDYAPGDIVYGMQGWQEWALSDGSDINRKCDPADGPLPANLHVLGLNGLTAYFGLLGVGEPKAGETVVVSTAAGAVGSIVGQIAKIKGCRTVGFTGSDDKVRDCIETFGYDAAINYRSTEDLSAALAEAAPDGVDVYFDNTSGPVSDAVMEHLNVGTRIVICGTMAIPSAPIPQGPRPHRQLLVARARMQGFLVLDHMHRIGEAIPDLAAWLREGRINFKTDIREGIEAAPKALVDLLAGKNQGKMLVKVADPGA